MVTSQKKGKEMSRKLSTKEIVDRCVKRHGDTYDYSKVVYRGYYVKIEIICRKHGSFWQDARNHYKLGAGCPKCAGNQVLGLEEFVKRARELHGSRYDYSLVRYVNNRQPVMIKCKEHGVFEQAPYHHLLGEHCRACAVQARKQTMLQRYGVEHALQCDEIRERMVNRLEELYGVTNVMHQNDIKRLVSESKKRNDSYRRSKTEDKLYDLLVARFGVDDVERQYGDSRYPFNCDFYVASRDMFIELNAFWSHGGHWFDVTDEQDVDKSQEWLRKGTMLYQNSYTVWMVKDIAKRQIAAENDLNYVVFWCNDLSDAQDWFDAGCPDSKDYIVEYYWNFFDGTPCAGKLARTVWTGGKDGDNLKVLPIGISSAPHTV